MIVERDENKRPGNATEPKRRQIVEIARSIEQERRSEVRFLLSIKFVDYTWRRREAQSSPPVARVDLWKPKLAVLPRVIQVEMKSAPNQKLIARLAKKLKIARFCDAQIFLGLFIIGIEPKRFTELNDSLGDLALG